MSAQAVTMLLEWASKNSRAKQKEFVGFYWKNYELYKNDETCGAPSNYFNMTMMERCIKDFEEQSK